MWEYGASLSYGFGTRSSLTLQNVYIYYPLVILRYVCVYLFRCVACFLDKGNMHDIIVSAG